MKENIFLNIFAIIFIFALIFESVILGYAYFNADTVECNFIWCEFKTVIKSEIYTECYENNIPINCSKIQNIKDTMKEFNVIP